MRRGNKRHHTFLNSLPSHRRSAPLDTRRRSVATRAPLHVVADLDRDFVSIVPRNPNHQRCLLHRNSTRNKKKERRGKGGGGETRAIANAAYLQQVPRIFSSNYYASFLADQKRNEQNGAVLCHCRCPSSLVVARSLSAKFVHACAAMTSQRACARRIGAF